MVYHHAGMDDRCCFRIFCLHEIQIIDSLKIENMLTMILFASGLICFALFFKSIDYFEKI